MSSAPDSNERILFVTGRLAAPIVDDVVARLAAEIGFQYEIQVLNVSVAALLTTKIISRRLQVNSPFDRVIIPGWCQGDIERLSEQFGIPFQRGPKNIFDLPATFNAKYKVTIPLDTYDIEILAEINHAPRLSLHELLHQAENYRRSGADVIDLGCDPGSIWNGVGKAVTRLRAEGFRISIDSFERREVCDALSAGAELVLSCNQTNVHWLREQRTEVVVLPDDMHDLSSMDDTIRQLEAAGTPYRIDPIIEPLGLGFTKSLVRYAETRSRWPNSEIMMGIGNITELTEVDSAGINTLLIGACQELGIRSVLTTEVINWCRSSVREIDLARRMMHVAVERRVPPKHFTSDLVSLRDPRLNASSINQLRELQAGIKDRNFRIFVADGELHMMNVDGHWHGTDPYVVFDNAMANSPLDDPQHAFYLGYELSKARTALTLGKNYVQDETLRWGFLTEEEVSAQDRRHQGRQTRKTD